jgi:hypothetical protein
LRAAGFYAAKERRTERTLRAYPERRLRYPPLNGFTTGTTAGIKYLVVHASLLLRRRVNFS